MLSVTELSCLLATVQRAKLGARGRLSDWPTVASLARGREGSHTRVWPPFLQALSSSSTTRHSGGTGGVKSQQQS